MGVDQVDVLPRWERSVYWFGGVGSMMYCFYSFYLESHGNSEHLTLQPGWKWLHKNKDADDLEWGTFCKFCPKLIPLLIGHIVISLLLSKLQLKIMYQKTLRLLYDLLAISFLFGLRATLLCIVESLIMYAVTFQNHTLVVWVVAVCFTTTLNYELLVRNQLALIGYSLFDNIIFFVSISYVHIRLISACIEIIRSKLYGMNNSSVSHSSRLTEVPGVVYISSVNNSLDNAQKSQSEGHVFKASLIDFMSYVFYLPIFFQGPILTFDEFLPQLNSFYTSGKRHVKTSSTAKKLSKLILIAAFIDFQSHFMYIRAVQADWRIVQKLSVASIVGLGVWQGQYFHLKYLCLFGVGSVVSELDGLLPPPPPTCIAWIYSFSDMWKYFDVGLYNFIKKYIYIPWGGSKSGFLYQICGVISAFGFIYYWHGAEPAILVWCLGNLIIIILEISAVHFESSKFGWMLKSSISPATQQRLRGFVTVPLYLASSLQVMYFFFSMQTGNVMVDKLVTNASWKSLCLEYICFYFAIQNAMLIRKWVIGQKKNKLEK